VTLSGPRTTGLSRRATLRREGEYLLRCLVSCGVCGHSMAADSQGRHTYHSFNVDHVSTSMPRRCPAPLVYAPDLDRLVWKEMTSLLSSPQHVVSGLVGFSFEDKQRLLRKLVERVYITAGR
jgi:Recombinase zinc beta ribbon domain